MRGRTEHQLCLSSFIRKNVAIQSHRKISHYRGGTAFFQYSPTNLLVHYWLLTQAVKISEKHQAPPASYIISSSLWCFLVTSLQTWITDRANPGKPGCHRQDRDAWLWCTLCSWCPSGMYTGEAGCRWGRWWSRRSAGVSAKQCVSWDEMRWCKTGKLHPWWSSLQQGVWWCVTGHRSQHFAPQGWCCAVVAVMHGESWIWAACSL